MRRRKSTSLAGPFVILINVTIAACFVFAVYAISTAAANSSIAIEMDRERRQREIASDLETVVTEWFAEQDYRVTWFDDQIEGKTFRNCRDAQGNSMALIWIDSAVLRLQYFQSLFKLGSTQWNDGDTFTDRNENGVWDGQTSESRAEFFNDGDRDGGYTVPSGQQIYEQFGRAIARHSKAINYVYLHGTTEPDERQERNMSIGRARSLSVDRANKVFNLLQVRGIVAHFGDEATASQLSAKFVIPYGTGDSRSYEPSTIERIVSSRDEDVRIGRVDILIVIGDVSDRN